MTRLNIFVPARPVIASCSSMITPEEIRGPLMTDQPTHQPLFTSVRMGSLELRNRIVMAPLTRMRAANPQHAPTELHAEYYAQRASAGLIIGECTEVSPDAYGWADTPGLWSAEQVKGGRGVA